jgi:hypothetical protein
VISDWSKRANRRGVAFGVVQLMRNSTPFSPYRYGVWRDATPGFWACLVVEVGNIGRSCYLHQGVQIGVSSPFKAHGVEHAPRLGRRVFPNQVAAKLPKRRNA